MLDPHTTLRSQAAGILHEISLLQDRIQQFRIELEPVQLQLDGITYPVLNLPSEITSEIFVHCLPDVISGEDAVNITEAPLLLLRICSQWRQIALSTPRLWTRLDMDLLSRHEHASEIAKTWLDCSRQHPLSVRLKGPMTNIHAPEVRSLKFDVSVDDWLRMPTRINFSHLRDLSLRLIEIDLTEDEVPEYRVEMFQTAHELHRVLLHQIPPRLLLLPWRQLRSFTGEFYEIEECIENEDELDDDGDIFANASYPNMRSFTLFRSRSDAENT
ncbi:hypothetical protein FB45DRAFT_1023997 [Roridomyces roridus]|uniref:F-box domain-containing protein n=1 Tax=Roridomyces roridus TaxID=1738132 RepID=A0AAD7C5J4_9AGAR|nr:hypothetical protein FB45DRAFT_1023997 [Roridomyces roridus]